MGNLDEVDQQRFEALMILACKNDAITAKELINIAMNLNEIDMHYIPVLNDKELGDFYIHNEFLPQLDNVPTDKADWMLSHIDSKKKWGKKCVNKKMAILRQRLCGLK